MASKARKAFNEHAMEIKELMLLDHVVDELIGETDASNLNELEILYKSAIVFTTSLWEAYCEDIADEGLRHITAHAKSAEDLPNELKKRFAKSIKGKNHDLELWKIADDGWRKYLRDHFKDLRNSDRRYSGSRPDKVNNLFKLAVGIEKISDSWRWPKMSPDQAIRKLNRYIDLRNAIVHRGSHNSNISKNNVSDYFNFINKIIGKTGGKVNASVLKITKKPLWEPKNTKRNIK